jgi:hypothetical protein
MSTAQTATTIPSALGDGLRRAWQINRPLTLFGLASVITLIVALIGMVVDPRAASAAPGWVKPTKFALSFVIYTATFLWLLSFVRGWPRLVAFVAGVTALMSTLELAIITMQVVRGTYSHFNNITPLDNTLFRLMGLAIVALWLMCVGLGVLLLLQRLPNPVIAWGLRLGVLVALVGMSVGFLMLGPKNEQGAALAAGQGSSLVGAHTIGAPDGGPGLPFVGWSTTHGDLRVGHFIGMHGMQALPLLAFILIRRRERWLTAGHQVGLVIIAGASYLGLIGLLTWQALRGQPVVAPDALTLGALTALVLSTSALVTAVLRHGWSRRTR